ncbi:MAG: gluconokinase [Actinomycetaceae bacterium]|nr:gluconokinase [Actinomycetaceae bacterium]
MSESDIPELPSVPRGKSPRNVVVMGVAGSGKTTIGMMLAGKLGFVYAEGDEFHTQANRDKQHAGIPLNDEDRQPWLESIRDWMRTENAVGHSTVVSCSALKRKYRDILRESGSRTIFVHVAPPRDLNEERIRSRIGHFMNPDLLVDQYATLEDLEPDEDGFVVDDPGAPEDVFYSAYVGLVELP